MEYKKYPFIVKGARYKLVYIRAPGRKNAVDRVLSLYPNKFVTLKQSMAMDLINAQEEAKKLSSNEKDTIFHLILEDDEFVVKRYDTTKEGDDIYSTWRSGKKIETVKPDPKVKKEKAEAPVKASAVKDTTNEEKKMKKIKKSAPKKAAKKVAPKKAAKKVAKKAAKKSAPKVTKKFEGAKIVSISIKDMRANLKKGYVYRDPQGVIQTEKYMATRAKQDHVREGMQEFKPVK